MSEVRVCEDIYPLKEGDHGNRKAGFAIHAGLKAQLDLLVKNIKNDWDFTIIITAGGEVRAGKSVLAMQIGAYWTYLINKTYGFNNPFNVEENYVLDGEKLIESGNKLGEKYKGACLVYDEAGADLEGRKVMSTSTQRVLDYFRECGQYNMLNILVLPEYFDLPKGIAISRSICLIDVYYTSDNEGIFERGYFNFYSRPNKKQLYIKGKRNLDYKAYRADFHGKFYDFYPIDEVKYRALKQEALKKRENTKQNRILTQRNYLIAWLHYKFKVDIDDLASKMSIDLGDDIQKTTLKARMKDYKSFFLD